jgi:hypothetical protein
MTSEREDIQGEAAKTLARLDRADRANALADFYAGSASHSYLRSIAAGQFNLLKPKRKKLVKP